MMEPVEDIFVRHTRQTWWGVRPGTESGGRGGHGKSQRGRGEVGVGVAVVITARKDKRMSLLSK